MKYRKTLAFVLVLALVMSFTPTFAISDTMTNTAENTISDDPGAGRLGGNPSSDFFSHAQEPSLFRAATPTYSHDSKFDGYTISNGIDVSSWNGTINWTKVAASGIDFAIIRVGYRGYGSAGTLNSNTQDDNFVKNIEGALAAGIKVGVYVFSQAITTTEAREEANYILSRIKKYKVTLPLVMDYEYAEGANGFTGRLYHKNLTRAQATNICMAFGDQIASAGYTPMIYANKDMLESSLNAATISKKYPIWLAHYTTKTTYKGDYTFWQYTASDSVNGISGKVDRNFWYQKPGQNIAPKPNTTVTPQKVTGLKTVSKTSTGLKLSWNRVSGASGYQIYRATAPNGTYTKVKTISSGSTISWTNSGLSRAREYYYKVRAYKTSNGKTYTGSFSSIFTVYTNRPYTITAMAKYSSNIRSKAGTNYSVVTTVPKGSKMNVYCSTRDKSGSVWYRIKATKNQKAYYGYIKGSLVSKKYTGAATTALHVRKGPSTKYAIRTTISKGQKVTIKSVKTTSSGARWYQITFSKKGKAYSGYASGSYIK